MKKKKQIEKASGGSPNTAGVDASAKPAVPENITAGDVEAPAFSLMSPPNIKFIGRKTWDAGKRKVLAEGVPLEGITDGGYMIALPPAETQLRRRMFWHKDAGRIIRLFPHLYKRVVRK